MNLTPVTRLVTSSDIAKVFADTRDTSINRGGDIASQTNPLDPHVGLHVLRAKQEEALQEREFLRLPEDKQGICRDCGEPISEKRLKALPFAVRCKGCQETYES